jgi:peptide/nickel transport system substrate-binding protein
MWSNLREARLGTRRPRASLALLVAAVTVLLGSSSLFAVHASSAGHPSGVVTFADQPGSNPNTPFPITGFAGASVANIGSFQFLMWRPLYWTGWPGNAAKQANYDLAYPPVYSSNGTTVTITLRHYSWSDGTPVTARDVEFWLNLVRANKTSYYDYSVGELPDDIVSLNIISERTFSITFNTSYSRLWLGNELSQIIPLPQQSWDRTSSTGADGNYDLTTTGAVSVFNFLTAQSNDEATIGTNSIWQTVDGPYHLKSFLPATGRAVLEANTSYSGPIKPTIAEVVEEPFTSDASEFNALRAGDIDYGYVPPEDVDQLSYLKSHGYTVDPWPAFGVNFIPINFTNPTTGPIFKQLYIRQAMQELIDEPAYITDFFHGYASPDYGPVAAEPASEFVGPAAKTNPYPYDPSRAKALLKAHGWTVRPNGTSSCANAGTASDECGAGIQAGQQLTFTMEYASGTAAWTSEMEALRSAFSLVGISLTLTSASFNTVLTYAEPCNSSTGAGCTWDMLYYGAGEFYVFNYEVPTGDVYFACSGAANFDGYCNSKADSLISATVHQSSLQNLYAYEKYLGEQVPYLWLPEADYQISVAKKSLSGMFPQDPELTISPETWRLK